MWQGHPRYKEIVAGSRGQATQGTPMFKIVTKLKRLKLVLKMFNKQEFREIRRLDAEAKEKMYSVQQMLQQEPSNADIINQEKEVRAHFNQMHKAYLSFLDQKTKIQWIKAGDENTTMFHTALKKRMSLNRVLAIENGNGQWIDHKEEITKAFIDYYMDLLGTQMQGRSKVVRNIMELGPKLTAEMGQDLIRPYNREEIKTAAFEIGELKAPGPDGFGSAFYH